MEPASIHIAHGIESETPDGSASESTAGAMSGACPPIFMAGDNAVVTTGSPGEVASADDYYPFGMVMEGRSFNYGQADTRYKFLTKERDTETGFDWLEARAYDARIGRFFVIDPLAEKATLRGWSPYHYSFDNPMRFADPSGLEAVDQYERNLWEEHKREFYGPTFQEMRDMMFGNNNVDDITSNEESPEIVAIDGEEPQGDKSFSVKDQGTRSEVSQASIGLPWLEVAKQLVSRRSTAGDPKSEKKHSQQQELLRNPGDLLKDALTPFSLNLDRMIEPAKQDKTKANGPDTPKVVIPELPKHTIRQRR